VLLADSSLRLNVSTRFLSPLAGSARMQIAAEDDCPDVEAESAECGPAPTGPRSLLEELDARQDEVLDQLEKLNGRIEKVIAQWSAWRGETGEKTALPSAA
jgi:hypothetical protein